MDTTINQANNRILNIAESYITDTTKQEGWSDVKRDEILAAATYAINTAFELLESWSNLDGDRTFGVSADRTFIFDPISKRDDKPFNAMSLYFNLWPQGCMYRDNNPPKAKSLGIHFNRDDFTNIESWNAIVNDVLTAIKEAEKLLNPTNPTTKED